MFDNIYWRQSNKRNVSKKQQKLGARETLIEGNLVYRLH